MLYTLLFITSPCSIYDDVELLEFFDKLKSWSKNYNITGCSAYIEEVTENKQCQFIHVLEGQREELEDIFFKSKLDISPGATILIKAGFVAKRTFSDWTLGIERIEFLTTPLLKGFFSMNYLLLAEDGDMNTNILMQFMYSLYKDRNVLRFSSIAHSPDLTVTNVVA